MRRIAVLLLVIFASARASGNDYASFRTVSGRLAGITRLLHAHPGLVAAFPTTAHSLFAPLEMAAALGEGRLSPRPLVPRVALEARGAFGEKLVLEEVPPWVALYRGFVVSDPFARRFPALALAASSRVFWVHDGVPGHQPKAFVHTVRAFDRDDGTFAPMLIQVVGEISELERPLLVASVDVAHGKVPIFVPHRTNPIEKLTGNRVVEFFDDRAGIFEFVRFPADWHAVGLPEYGQRARPRLPSAGELFDIPLSRRAKLQAIEPSPSVTVTAVKPQFEYIDAVPFTDVSPWERSLLAATLYESRDFERPGVAALARPVQEAEGDGPNTMSLIFDRAPSLPIADILRLFAVTERQIEAAQRVRSAIRPSDLGEPLVGRVDGRTWRDAREAGATSSDVFCLPPRVLAESLVHLVRSGDVERRVALERLPGLWETLLAEYDDVATMQGEGVLFALSQLIPLAPDRFDQWDQLVDAHPGGDRDWVTFLWAIRTGDLPFIERMRARLPKLDRRTRTTWMRSAFAQAAEIGHADSLRRLRQLAGYLDRPTLEDAVVNAAYTRNSDLVRQLLREGAFKKRSAASAMELAAEQGDGETLKVLLEERGASPDELETLLISAFLADGTGALRVLLDRYSFSEELLANLLAWAVGEDHELQVPWLVASLEKMRCAAELASSAEAP